MRKLIIGTNKYKDIPYSEYYLDSGCNKSLVFIQHGFQSNKEYGADYLALTLARSGCRVIAIDAYKHGERIEEPYITGANALRYAEIFHVVDQTAKDIVTLYNDIFEKSYPTFDMIGVSMGGFISYSVSLKTDKINKLVPAITTPMFLKLAMNRENVESIEEYQTAVAPLLPFIKSIDPYSKKEKITYKEMMIVSGENDPIIPVEDSVKFFREINDCKSKLQIYNEVHEVNREMQNAICMFIISEKAVS